MPANFPRSFRKSVPQAVRGEGVYLWDSDGRKYLDFSGSAAVNFIGHGVAAVSRAMAEQAERLEFVHSTQFTTPAAEELAQEILEFAGQGFRGGRVYFTCGGSEAIETALKLARQYQVEIGESDRHQVVSRNQSYHGSTLGAVAVSGNRRRREIFLPMVRPAPQARTPYCYRCHYPGQDCARAYADEVARALDSCAATAAAFLFEPVSGATLGAVVPPDGYLQAVAAICSQRGVLLIADEVMTGFGRTGRNFAVRHWSVEPDIIVAGKGIASGYAPLGAVIASKKVVDAIANGSGAFVHGFTYNAHPVSVAAGLATLRQVQAGKLVEAADSRTPGKAASQLANGLRTLLACSSVGDVRGIGLLWGVEFVADKGSKAPFDPQLRFSDRVAQAAARRGLLVYPMQGCVDGISGDHLLIAPPAIIAREEIDWAVERLRESIEEATDSLSAG
jgi:adenosylmethionine-8-amino-7-oxononanoate aminotransferase